MKRYKGYLYHTITAEDVKNPLSLGVEKWMAIKQCIGQFLPCDIGKQVYKYDGICHVESDEQMKVRLTHGSNLYNAKRRRLNRSPSR